MTVQVQVDVVMMAHPRRAEFVDELLSELDRPAQVVWDAGDDNRWSTGRRSWQAIDKSATYGLVLQDDAVVCRDLVAGLESALTHVPDGSPVCLYAGRVRPFRTLVQQLVDRADADTAWLTMGQIHWGVGIALPTGLIDDMLAWCDQRTDVANYDKRISRWCQHHGLTVYYPWPSLVDHRDSPSLVPGRSSYRRHAHRFLGTGQSALERDWSGIVTSIPALNTPLDASQIATGTWRVVGHAARATVATNTGGRASKLHFRGAILTGVPLVEVRHLLSIGLIEPVHEASMEVA